MNNRPHTNISSAYFKASAMLKDLKKRSPASSCDYLQSTSHINTWSSINEKRFAVLVLVFHMSTLKYKYYIKYKNIE